jgi:predicted nucleic acid-binding protein
MALTHLVDTSVLTRVGYPSVRSALEPLVAAGSAARAGISDLEVGFSARNDKEWDQLIGALQPMELVETSAAHVARARQTQRLLSAKRQRGRKVPDLLIAAAAEEYGLTLLHYDTDFDLIAEVTGQSCQWIVTKGSID